jgi:hypothetical protein
MVAILGWQSASAFATRHALLRIAQAAQTITATRTGARRISKGCRRDLIL